MTGLAAAAYTYPSALYNHRATSPLLASQYHTKFSTPSQNQSPAKNVLILLKIIKI
jgi:hypothetical protein